MRKEKNSIGEELIPDDALYGINAIHAKNNFPGNSLFNFNWYKAVGLVKKAVYQSLQKYQSELRNRYPEQNQLIKLDDKTIDSLIKAASEVSDGKHFDNFIVPSVQGGAGTSINMNINEIIANRALQIRGYKPGDYKIIDPIESANIYQSTNDVIPTALKVAVLTELQKLEENINDLRFAFEKIENQNRNKLRLSYTQLQQAVPSSFGKLFSAYNDALSRDWWRVSKCFERIKQVNLGGNAIGTGLSVPRFIIMEAVRELQKLTNLPVNRSENMTDTTSNLDSWTEIHATLKAHAVNLEKMSNDLRLLSSDISAEKSIEIPAKQTGSSVMPGKINPVIPEFIISSSHNVYANDVIISSLSGQSMLELNAYLPTIGHAVLNSIELLNNACISMRKNLAEELSIISENAYKKLINSPSVSTAFVPYIGYHKAAEIAETIKTNELNVFEACKKTGHVEDEKVREIMKPENLLKLGFSVKDIINFNKKTTDYE